MRTFLSRSCGAVLPSLFLLYGLSGAATLRAAQARDRISGEIDDRVTVTARGNIRPEVSRATSLGLPEQDLPMQNMILTLKADAAQEAALADLVKNQQDPRSPQYHKFLTPQQYGEQFGASPNDIAKITSWLQGHGFKIEQVPAGRRSIVFSGAAGAVTAAFGTPIRKVVSGGEVHYANTAEPQIPAALADVVGGLVKLNDFHHKPAIQSVRPLAKSAAAAPQFTYGSSHYLSPADYATIYNLSSLYSNQIDGSGQSIAIVARSNISMSDLQTFRSEFGLPANNPKVIIASGSDPGFVPGDGDEATLDVQWSGAVAPKATVNLVVANSTASADGVDLSAQYIVNHNIAPVMSVSFGSCEAAMGSGGVGFYNALWQQAAAQGITVLISSGDSGAAGCNWGGSSTGSTRGVNGLCSSQYDVCVGGTEFVEGSNPGQYWLPGNNPTMGSAQSYIPETVWNESGSNGGSGLWAGGGGASIYFTKPTWQTGAGVPADGARDVPDVALTASGHDGYLIEENGGMYVIAGTSAASPSFAGIMALVNQKMGARLGAPNATLYSLASLQNTGGAQVFHDTTAGSNSVPGVTGFVATNGYDLATGLGSVDAAALVNHWTDASAGTNSPTLAAVNTPATLNLAPGATTSFATKITGGGTFKSPVALSVTGAPAGVTVTLSANSVASPGSGSVTTSVVASKTAAAGTYTITVTATGANLVAKATTVLTIATPSFSLTPSTTAVTVATGGNATLSLSVAPTNGFNSTVALTAAGLPAGVTASFSPATVTASTGASTLTFTATQAAKAGIYPVTITAAAAGITKTATVNLTVTNPSFTLTSSSAPVTLSIGGKVTAPVSVTPSSGFNSTVALTASGLPAGVTASFSPASLNASAAGASTLTLTAGSTAKAGTYSAIITATGGGLTKTTTLIVTIPAPSFTLNSSAASATLTPGGTASLGLSITPAQGFSSLVSLTASGVPAGVTASFSPAALSPSATSTFTLTAAQTAKAGTYPVTVTAIGGGLTKTATVNLTVTAAVNFTVTASPTALSVPRGGTGQSVVMTYLTGPFTSAISLSASGMPTGVQASFNSTTIAAGAGNVITLAVGPNAALGTSTITVTATGGGLTRTATVQLTVQPAPAFTLGFDHQFITVQAGGPSVTPKLSITSTAPGFNSPITLLVAGRQNNISQSFSTSTLTVAAPSSTLSVSAASNATPGIYTIALAGYTNTLQQTVLLSVTVTAPAQAKH